MALLDHVSGVCRGHHLGLLLEDFGAWLGVAEAPIPVRRWGSLIEGGQRSALIGDGQDRLLLLG